MQHLHKSPWLVVENCEGFRLLRLLYPAIQHFSLDSLIITLIIMQPRQADLLGAAAAQTLWLSPPFKSSPLLAKKVSFCYSGFLGSPRGRIRLQTQSLGGGGLPLARSCLVTAAAEFPSRPHQRNKTQRRRGGGGRKTERKKEGKKK